MTTLELTTTNAAHGRNSAHLLPGAGLADRARLTRADTGTTRGFCTGRRDASPSWMISRVSPPFPVNFPKMPGMHAPEILDRA
jgi:hypothetical protein